MQVIKQVIVGSGDTQTIKMVVRSNERGPKGEQGERGTQGPQGIPGPRGLDGAIQYRAGTGINISDDNIITATGGATAEWGGIQGDITDQTDLQNALNAKQNVLSDFTGATGVVAGTAGLVPAPAATDNTKYLKGDGTWSTVSVPTVNNASLTIQNNGTTVGTFTANASTNVTANIVSPVKIGSTSGSNVQLTNASNATIYPYINAGSLPNNVVTGAKIASNTVTSDKLNLTNATDGSGWRKIQLSSSINLYLKEGSSSWTMGANTWNQMDASTKPADLNTSNTFFGGAGGLSLDHAINVCGNINSSSGGVQIQTQNIFSGSITTTIYWWAYIVEIVS